jgi:hypothetical protein
MVQTDEKQKKEEYLSAQSIFTDKFLNLDLFHEFKKAMTI